MLFWISCLWVYGVLKNGVVVHPASTDQDPLIQIACEVAEAERLALLRSAVFSLKPLLNLKRAIKTPQPLSNLFLLGPYGNHDYLLRQPKN
jgi:hypothetical protein